LKLLLGTPVKFQVSVTLLKICWTFFTLLWVNRIFLLMFGPPIFKSKTKLEFRYLLDSIILYTQGEKIPYLGDKSPSTQKNHDHKQENVCMTPH
jgi:hypothetical protein